MKKVLYFGLLSTILILFIGCSSTESVSTEASMPDGYDIVSKDSIGRSDIYTLKHLKTKCYYTAIEKKDYRGGVSVEQMMVEAGANRQSVPYCE